MPVLDIMPERLEPDLGRLEHHLRCAQKPRCAVDDADGGERRSLRGAQRPHAQRIECRDRARQQRRGAVVGGRRLRDQRRLDARRGKRNRGGQARGAAPNHCHINVPALHAPYLTARARKNDPGFMCLLVWARNKQCRPYRRAILRGRCSCARLHARAPLHSAALRSLQPEDGAIWAWFSPASNRRASGARSASRSTA